MCSCRRNHMAWVLHTDTKAGVPSRDCLTCPKKNKKNSSKEHPCMTAPALLTLTLTGKSRQFLLAVLSTIKEKNCSLFSWQPPPLHWTSAAKLLSAFPFLKWTNPIPLASLHSLYFSVPCALSDLPGIFCPSLHLQGKGARGCSTSVERGKQILFVSRGWWF